MRVGNFNMLSILLAIGTVCLYNIAYILAFLLRFDFHIPMFNFNSYMESSIVMTMMMIMVYYLLDLFTTGDRKSFIDVFGNIVIATFTMTVLTVAISFWMRAFTFPRSVVVISFFVQTVLIGIFQYIIWKIEKNLIGNCFVCIIEEDIEKGKYIAQRLQNHTSGWYSVEQILSIKPNFLQQIKWDKIQTIVIGAELPKYEKELIINHGISKGKELIVVPNLKELCIINSKIQRIDDMMVLSIKAPTLTRQQLLFKRVADICISATLFLVASPIFALLYILIPVTSQGAAIYKQERIGLYGKKFNLLKFRSMVDNAEEFTGPTLATEDDHRITSFGKVMRLMRLDELPQLINVLKGDMSLIGPRPEREFFVNQFQADLPVYAQRHQVKPGITGLAQVMGKYSTTADEKIKYDLMYIFNYSFLLDIKILFSTVLVVLRRDKANGIIKNQDFQFEKYIS